MTSEPRLRREPIHHSRSETYSRPGAGARWGTEDGRAGLEDTVMHAVDSYMEARDERTCGKYRVPAATPPTYKKGEDLKCFLSDFQDMVTLADLKPSHQMAYLKQAVPAEAKTVLFQQGIKTVEEATEMLTELYEPKRDAWTVLREVDKITQGPEERFLELIGRIEAAVRRYAEMVHMNPGDFEQIVKDRFKHAIADPETRNQFLWDKSDMTTKQMAITAQQFYDLKLKGKDPSQKKVLRTAERSPERDKLKAEIADLKKQIAELALTKKAEPRAQDETRRKPNFACWNCGKPGHYSRSCKAGKVGDGYSHRPSRVRHGRSDGGAVGSRGEQSGDLNGQVQRQ